MNDYTVVAVWKIVLAGVCCGFIFSSGFHFGAEEAKAKCEIRINHE